MSESFGLEKYLSGFRSADPEEESADFTISPEAMASRLGKFERAEPGYHLAMCLRGARLLGGQEFAVEWGQKHSEFRFSADTSGLEDWQSLDLQHPLQLGYLAASWQQDIDYHWESKAQAKLGFWRSPSQSLSFWDRLRRALRWRIDEHSTLKKRATFYPVPVSSGGRLLQSSDPFLYLSKLMPVPVIDEHQIFPIRSDEILAVSLTLQKDGGVYWQHDTVRIRRLASHSWTHYAHHNVSESTIEYVFLQKADGQALEISPLVIDPLDRNSWRHSLPLFSDDYLGNQVREPVGRLDLSSTPHLRVLERPLGFLCQSVLGIRYACPKEQVLIPVKHGIALDPVKVDLGCPGAFAIVDAPDAPTDLSGLRLRESDWLPDQISTLKRSFQDLKARVVGEVLPHVPRARGRFLKKKLT